jgi:hypothetical protein
LQVAHLHSQEETTMQIVEQPIQARVNRDLISLVVFLLALGLWLALVGAAFSIIPSRTTPSSSVWAFVLGLSSILPMMLGGWLFGRHRRQRALTESAAASGQSQRAVGSRTSLLPAILYFGIGLSGLPRAVHHQEWFWVVFRSLVMVGGLWMIFVALRLRHRQKELDRSGPK